MNFKKDPSEVLDYTVSWASVLTNGEAIATSDWSVSGSGLTLGTGPYASTNDASAATCWLSAGTVDSTYTVTNRIVTDHSPARTFERSFTIRITEL